MYNWVISTIGYESGGFLVRIPAGWNVRSRDVWRPSNIEKRVAADFYIPNTSILGWVTFGLTKGRTNTSYFDKVFKKCFLKLKWFQIHCLDQCPVTCWRFEADPLPEPSSQHRPQVVTNHCLDTAVSRQSKWARDQPPPVCHLQC